MVRARVNFGGDQSDVTIRRSFAVTRDERTIGRVSSKANSLTDCWGE